jgi:hypothetical protein
MLGPQTTAAAAVVIIVDSTLDPTNRASAREEIVKGRRRGRIAPQQLRGSAQHPGRFGHRRGRPSHRQLCAFRREGEGYGLQFARDFRFRSLLWLWGFLSVQFLVSVSSVLRRFSISCAQVRRLAPLTSMVRSCSLVLGLVCPLFGAPTGLGLGLGLGLGFNASQPANHPTNQPTTSIG